MENKYMQYKQTPNIKKSNIPKIGYVIHGTTGSYEGACVWLCTPPNKRNPITYSSAHYVISKKGEVTQLAKNEDITWHAGIVRNPTWRARKYLPTVSGIPMLPPFKNPNDSFIGIELEWFQGDDVTEEQYDAVVDIVKSSNIINPIIISHSEITDYKADFGRDEKGMFVVQEIIRRIK